MASRMPAHAAAPDQAALDIVAAEAVWADITRQIGGDAVQVSSVLNAPDIDPHLFEPGPAIARDMAAARIVIANGGGYDPWMDRLGGQGAPQMLRISTLAGWQDGENMHFWYDPVIVRRFASTIANALSVMSSPAEAAAIRQHQAGFQASVTEVETRIAALRARIGGTVVAATEPVFGRMAILLGLDMREDAFQHAVMNDVEPGPAAVATFERDLQSRVIRVLFINAQTSSPAADRLVGLARAAGVPVIAIPETLPPGQSWQGWMNTTLDAVAAALGAA